MGSHGGVAGRKQGYSRSTQGGSRFLGVGPSASGRAHRGEPPDVSVEGVVAVVVQSPWDAQGLSTLRPSAGFGSRPSYCKRTPSISAFQEPFLTVLSSDFRGGVQPGQTRGLGEHSPMSEWPWMSPRTNTHPSGTVTRRRRSGPRVAHTYNPPPTHAHTHTCERTHPRTRTDARTHARMHAHKHARKHARTCMNAGTRAHTDTRARDWLPGHRRRG